MRADLGDRVAGTMAGRPTRPDPRWRVATDGAPGEMLAGCLVAAVAAPSLHNSQPWRFEPHDGGVDVLADRDRQLPVTDPAGRELTMSVGAAVFNLRVAVLAHGRLPLLTLLPDPGRPDLLARLTFGPRVASDATVRLLHQAIPRRHSNRRPFREIPVPPPVLAELVAAARAEHGLLTALSGPVRDRVLDLVRTGERQRRNDPEYWIELDRWTREAPGRRDGIPPAAFGPWPTLRRVPVRDFGLLRVTPRRGVREFEHEPVVVVLHSFGDRPRDWLRSGMALQRVLLTATVRGLASTLMTQPLELPRLRAGLSDTGGHTAQAIIRIGYGPPSTPTPRRSLAEVLAHAGPGSTAPAAG